MDAIASQIASLTIVYSIVYSDADQRKHQSSASLAFVRWIHRGPVNSPHKWPVTRKMFPFDDVIIFSPAPSPGYVSTCHNMPVWNHNRNGAAMINSTLICLWIILACLREINREVAIMKQVIRDLIPKALLWIHSIVNVHGCVTNLSWWHHKNMRKISFINYFFGTVHKHTKSFSIYFKILTALYIYIFFFKLHPDFSIPSSNWVVYDFIIFMMVSKFTKAIIYHDDKTT